MASNGLQHLKEEVDNEPADWEEHTSTKTAKEQLTELAQHFSEAMQ